MAGPNIGAADGVPRTQSLNDGILREEELNDGIERSFTAANFESDDEPEADADEDDADD